MAAIRYVGGAGNSPAIKVCVSMNNGRSWQEKMLVSGQSFPIPPNATNLLMDNVPYDPEGNYEIRQGRIAQY